MEEMFTFPYSESEAKNELQRELKKQDENSFYIPTSQQQEKIYYLVDEL